MNQVVVIGASAGGVEALIEILSGLPADFAAPVLIVMHIGEHPSVLPLLLARNCALPVMHARHGQPVLPGVVLVAPPGRHLMIERTGDGLATALTNGAKENHSRPSIDTLFRSAAVSCGERTVGIILTGYLDDGVAGLQAIKARGGLAIVQDPADATVPDMPRNALEQVDVDLCLPLAEMAPALVARVAVPQPAVESTASSEPAISAVAAGSAVPEWMALENRFAQGEGDMRILKRIGNPSPYSCPECGGALFALNHAQPCRFRCHTGHSYTLLSLLQQQETAIEMALRSATRALQEKENLAEQLATEFSARSLRPEPGYAALARRAREDAGVVRELMARQDLGDVPLADPAGAIKAG